MPIANVLKEKNGAPVKIWTDDICPNSMEQLLNTARLPFIHKHIAAMPDVHLGMGATIGSVVPTRGAIIPAAVGVDIGCGMAAVRLSLSAEHLPDNIKPLRDDIERAVPHGFVTIKGRSTKGCWAITPNSVISAWRDPFTSTGPGNWSLAERLGPIIRVTPHLAKKDAMAQLGTMGGGNHFIEVCLDEENRVWIMLHSGSRGIGNMIGQHWIKVAMKDMETHHIRNLPDKNLSYLSEGTDHFDDYIEAMTWAQDYAALNRRIMMGNVLSVLRTHSREYHFGQNVWVTRKGAVRAQEGDMGIIPGSMGAQSFITRGKGNADSFNSSSHGAGRAMSRTEAKKRFTTQDLEAMTAGVECPKDAARIDEIPAAYKPIRDVMDNQHDLVEIVHTLKQVVNVKG
jgi:tRNA-splicing ligase RtcB